MELKINGTEFWQIKQYLLDLGGVEGSELEPGAVEPGRAVALVRGAGWEAHLTEGVYAPYPPLFVVPQVTVRFAGEPEAVAVVHKAFMVRAWRAGG